VNDFDSTLTQKEKDEPNYLNWSDKTLARLIRHLAKRTHDKHGASSGLYGAGALLLGAGLAQAGARSFTFDAGNLHVTARMGD